MPRRHRRKLTPSRKAKCIRDPKGRFKEWLGGKSIITFSKKWRNNNAHGIYVHIGREFVRQYGRRAVVGDIVRKKRKDGRYHKGADWYVRTPYGWRDTGSARRPSKKRIAELCKQARRKRPRK